MLRNLLGWRLIDVSYITLNQTVKSNMFRKTNQRQKGGIEDRLPTFDELSIQVRTLPICYIQESSVLMSFALRAVDPPDVDISTPDST